MSAVVEPASLQPRFAGGGQARRTQRPCEGNLGGESSTPVPLQPGWRGPASHCEGESTGQPEPNARSRAASDQGPLQQQQQKLSCRPIHQGNLCCFGQGRPTKARHSTDRAAGALSRRIAGDQHGDPAAERGTTSRIPADSPFTGGPCCAGMQRINGATR